MPGPEANRGGAGRGPNPNNAPANNPYPTSRPGEGSRWVSDRMNEAFHSPIERNETRGIIGNTKEFIRMHGGERLRRIFETLPSIDKEVRLNNEMARTINELDQGRVVVNSRNICSTELQAVTNKLNLPPGGRAVIHLESSDSYIVFAGDGRAQVLMANPRPEMYKQHLKDIERLRKEEEHLDELRNAMSRRTFLTVITDVGKWTLNVASIGKIDMRTRSRIERTEQRIREINLNEAAYRGVYGPIEAAIRNDLQAIVDPNIATTRQAKAVLTKEQYEANTFGMRRYSGVFSKVLGINADTRLLHDGGNTLADAAREMITGRATRTMFEGIQLISANSTQGRVNIMGEPTTTPNWVRVAAQQSMERRTRQAVRQEIRTAFEGRATAQNLRQEVRLSPNEQRDIAEILRKGLRRKDKDPLHKQTLRQEAISFTILDAAGRATIAVMVNDRGEVLVRQLTTNGNARSVRNALTNALRVYSRNMSPATMQQLRNDIYIQNTNTPIARPQLQYVFRQGQQIADNQFGLVTAPPVAPAQPRPVNQQRTQIPGGNGRTGQQTGRGNRFNGNFSPGRQQQRRGPNRQTNNPRPTNFTVT